MFSFIFVIISIEWCNGFQTTTTDQVGSRTKDSMKYKDDITLNPCSSSSSNVLSDMFHVEDDYSSCTLTEEKPCPNVPKCKCTPCVDGFNVNCTKANLSHIPTGLPNNTVRLLLAENLISDIGYGVFQNYTTLKKLDISTNKISSLKEADLKGLPQLQSLSLVNNTITYIDPGTFAELKEIHSIDLSYNIKLGFHSLQNISSGLEHTNISKLNLTKVHGRDIGCVQIIQSDLENLNKTNIKYLILDSNALVSLTKDAVHFIPRSLKGISLRDNKLSFGPYIYDILSWGKMENNLEIFIMSEQNTNHLADGLFQQLGTDVQTKIRARRNINSHVFHEATMKTLIPTSKQQKDLEKMPYSTQLSRWRNKRIDNGKYDSSHTRQHKIVINLPKNLKHLDLSGNQVRLQIKGINFAPNKLTMVKINKNMYWNMQGPVEGVTNLQGLDASWNNCRNISKTFFHNLPMLKYLNLSMNFLGPIFKTDTQGIIFQKLSNLKCLDLSQNRIASLPFNIFNGLQNLSHLYLARNQLTTFKTNVKIMQHLTMLDLQDNFLIELDQTMTMWFDRIQGKHLTLILKDNAFLCTCTSLHFIQWISGTEVHLEDFQMYSCKFSNGTKGNLTFAMQVYDRLSQECATYSTLITISVSFLAMFFSIVAAATVYRYRWNLQYMYYSAKIKYKGYVKVKNEEIKFDFDVFVSYCDTEGLFVRQQIISELEEKRQVHLLIHERDFLPGNFVADNIMRAITTSRKVLIILSQNYLRSTWCRYEMNMARMEHIKTGRDVICVLLKESIPTRNLPLEVIDMIKNQTYVELPPKLEDIPTFWDRMQNALLD